jgi:hypothetical protein
MKLTHSQTAIHAQYAKTIRKTVTKIATATTIATVMIAEILITLRWRIEVQASTRLLVRMDHHLDINALLSIPLISSCHAITTIFKGHLEGKRKVKKKEMMDKVICHSFVGPGCSRRS